MIKINKSFLFIIILIAFLSVNIRSDENIDQQKEIYKILCGVWDNTPFSEKIEYRKKQFSWGMGFMDLSSTIIDLYPETKTIYFYDDFLFEIISTEKIDNTLIRMKIKNFFYPVYFEYLIHVNSDKTIWFETHDDISIFTTGEENKLYKISGPDLLKMK